MKIRKNGRIIRLTESDLKKITMLNKRILREHKSPKHYKMLDKISHYVEIPYIESMEALTIFDKDDQEYILSKIFNANVYIKGSGFVYNVDDGRQRYFEDNDGETWYIFEDDFE
jgi:uncharacterized protein YozE (UPF0346 family)